jgi:antitoxin component YwqK of YwqJK toxin-antitoxin module
MDQNQYVRFDQLRHDEEGRMLLDGVPLTGIAVEYWSSGAKASEISFREGLQHGWTIGWHENGTKSEETMYVEGNARGVRREWHENGQLKLEQDIGERATLLSSREWDEHGRLIKSKPPVS